MLLKAASASASASGFYLYPSRVESGFSPPTPSSILRFESRRNGLVALAAKESNSRLTTGVVFEPFEEVKNELFLTPSVPQVSLARQKFVDESEAAINEQINVEYNVSYVYHAMYAYFDRDNVALRGLANFFKESSEEERQHAEKLMEYQNKRGGRVQLQSIVRPLSEFDHAEKGDALYGNCAITLTKSRYVPVLLSEAVFLKILNLTHVESAFYMPPCLIAPQKPIFL